tara:strand:+ start:448 stop:810 length:363 start_codon:yes stop_codon:yes gene_type:complete
MFSTLKLTTKEQRFVTQYFTTALWENGADYLDLDQIDEDCLREGTIDALSFYSRACMRLSDDNYTQAAHTFYLVRQGHGVAFDDGDDYGFYIAKELQKLAESYGVVDYYTVDGKSLSEEA